VTTPQIGEELQSLFFLIITATVQSARRLTVYAFQTDSFTSDES